MAYCLLGCSSSRQLTHPFPQVSCVRSLVSQLSRGDKLHIIFRLLIAEKEISRVRAGSQIRGLDSRLSIFLSNSRGAFSLTLPSLGIVEESASTASHSDKSVPERMEMAGGRIPPLHCGQVKAFDTSGHIALFVQPW